MKEIKVVNVQPKKMWKLYGQLTRRSSVSILSDSEPTTEEVERFMKNNKIFGEVKLETFYR